MKSMDGKFSPSSGAIEDTYADLLDVYNWDPLLCVRFTYSHRSGATINGLG
jgi:hypothetical protein